MIMEVQVSKTLQKFTNKQKVLVVGEGDFSFSMSLAKAFGFTTNFTSSSIDIREGLGRNYNTGKGNVEELEKLGCKVVRGVDIHSMTSDYRLGRYDVIIFNLPHAEKHPEVMSGFMMSAREMVKDEDGEIHVTHNSIYPFRERGVKALAEESGLRLIQKNKFSKWVGSESSSHCFPFGSDVTHMFKKGKMGL